MLIIGASIALGLNIASSLKAMAVDFRWWLLSLHERPLKEVDLILRLESLSAVFELVWSKQISLLSLLCVAWLALNIVRTAFFGFSSKLGKHKSPTTGTHYSLDKGRGTP